MSNSIYAPQPIRLELIKRLAKAQPPARPREIRDRAARIILRHQPTGHLALYVELGRGKRERLCDARHVIDPHTTLTFAMVRAKAERIRGEHLTGRDFAGERRAQRATPTFEAYLVGTYGPWVKQNRKSGAATLCRLEACFSEELGKEKLDTISPARLERWRARRQRTGIKPETINRDIVALRAALSRAVRLGVLDLNPIAGVERDKVDPHKELVRPLSTTEKKRLLDALATRDARKRDQRESANTWRSERGYELKPPLGGFADALTPAVVTSLETGLRRGELFALEWQFIDLHEKTLRVAGANAKTYETRDIPLNDLAHKTLHEWWTQCGKPTAGPMLTRGGETLRNLKKSYHAVLATAGIDRSNAKGERVNWHSLRHTFATLLGAAGVEATVLMKLMGHASLATTQRYLHADSDRKRAAVDLLA